MKFLNSNSTLWRLIRTVVQAAVGFIISNADIIFMQFYFIPEIWRPIIMGFVITILTALMSEIGGDKHE